MQTERGRRFDCAYRSMLGPGHRSMPRGLLRRVIHAEDICEGCLCIDGNSRLCTPQASPSSVATSVLAPIIVEIDARC
jgi:hypothetical protein